MNNKHADPLDSASEYEQANTETYIAQARAKNRPEQIQNPDGTWPETECLDCGEEIPKGRLELGKIRCVECQEFLEKRQRLGL